jgi:hypothetical protein
MNAGMQAACQPRRVFYAIEVKELVGRMTRSVIFPLLTFGLGEAFSR